MDVKLTHSKGGGGRGNSPPYAKNEGGGGGNCPLCAKRWEGKCPPLIILQGGNALTLPKIGGELSYLPDLSRGGNVQGGKCPDTADDSFDFFLFFTETESWQMIHMKFF